MSRPSLSARLATVAGAPSKPSFTPEPEAAPAPTPAARAVARARQDKTMIAGYFTTCQWAEAHPDLVKKFQAAIRETAQWANNPANTDKSADMLATLTKIDAAVVKSSVRAKFGLQLSPAAIQPTIDLAARYKLLEHFPANELIYIPK